MSVFRLVIRTSTAWSNQDQVKVVTRAAALKRPAPRVTERGLELSVNAPTGEVAIERVEAAVHGIRPHTGVYIAEAAGSREPSSATR